MGAGDFLAKPFVREFVVVFVDSTPNLGILGSVAGVALCICEDVEELTISFSSSSSEELSLLFLRLLTCLLVAETPNGYFVFVDS